MTSQFSVIRTETSVTFAAAAREPRFVFSFLILKFTLFVAPQCSESPIIANYGRSERKPIFSSAGRISWFAMKFFQIRPVR